MTKAKLFAMVDETMLTQNKKIELKAAVEAFEKALLQQTPCSTLREILIQMYNSDNDDTALIPEENPRHMTRLGDLIAIQRVLSLINDMKPVA